MSIALCQLHEKLDNSTRESVYLIRNSSVEHQSRDSLIREPEVLRSLEFQFHEDQPSFSEALAQLDLLTRHTF